MSNVDTTITIEAREQHTLNEEYEGTMSVIAWEAEKARTMLNDLMPIFACDGSGDVPDSKIRTVRVCFTEIAAKLSLLGDAIDNITATANEAA